MGFLYRFGALTLVFFFAVISDVSADSKIEVYPNEYVVELAPQAAALRADPQTFSNSNADYKIVKKLGSNDALISPPHAALAAQTEGGASERRVEDFDVSDTFCADLVSRHIAESCSPNFVYRASVVSNDPKQSDEWALNSTQGVDAYSAWDVGRDASNVVVAVVDTGVDYTHPDLAQNMWTNPFEIPGNGIDDDGNGYIDDVHGINAITHSGDPMDDNGHGTHVSGTIGARGNNGVGVVGMSWNSQIMALKFLASDGSGSLADAITAFNYIVDMKNRGVNVRVSSNSWGGGGFSQSLAQAIQRAGQAGVIVVAAAGNEANDNDTTPQYPSSIDSPYIVSVAAVDQDRNLASFSNYGRTTVDIAAPGVGILSTYKGGTYAILSGTSMATPHVSGALALLLGQQPGLSNAEAQQRLLLSGTDLPSLLGISVSSRMLNLNRLLRGEVAPLPNNDNNMTCQYGAAKIPFNPDSSSDNTSVVADGDEFNFYTVKLPFALPFYDTTVSQVAVSPNGVIYMGSAPDGLDYQNSSRAPQNSFAALQTDLDAEGAGYGVRVAKQADQVVISWLTHHFSQKTGAAVRVWVTLHSNGTIDEFLSFGSADVEAAVAASSTLGISGKTPISSTTFAYDSSAIRSGLGLRWTSNCSTGSVASVKKLDIKTVSRTRSSSSGSSKYVSTGSKIRITVSGASDGAVALSARIDSYQCNVPASINLRNGKVSIVSRVPSSLIARAVKFTAGNVSKRIYLNSHQRSQRAKRKSRAKVLDRACASLLHL
jgi:subtilisin family serine protease